MTDVNGTDAVPDEDVNKDDNSSDKQQPPAAPIPQQQYRFRSFRTTDTVVTELRVDEVRWHYRAPLDKQWKPFNGHDSILIETKWRLLRNIWADNQEAIEKCQNDVVVLGGLFKVFFDEEELEARPIYWTVAAKHFKLHRGTWFFEDSMQPMEEDLAESIEDEHLRVFRDQKIPKQPVFFDKETTKKPLLATLKLKECEVKWNSIIDVTLFSTSAKSRLLRLVPLIKKGVCLYRGFKNASLSDGPKPIGHLVFVIPGIGQKRQVQRIVERTDEMRGISEELLQKYFPESESRPLFLPVEWRSTLKLDGDLVDSITLPFVESIRSTVNSTLMDILYYTSPNYRTEISNGLIKVMNDLYGLFMSHNSHFLHRKGRISIVAHSLGSVIAYDILTAHSPLQMYDDYVTTRIEEHLAEVIADESGEGKSIEKADLLKQLHEARLRLHELEGGFLKMLRHDAPRLDFTVDNLFALGSPLAIFLALRQQKPQDIITCQQPRRLYNIFHATDPVAYRLEPLVHKNYRSIRPLRIHYHHNAQKKKVYGKYEPELQRFRTMDSGASLDRTLSSDKIAELILDRTQTDEAEEAALSSGQESDSSPELERKNKKDNESKGWFSKFRQPAADVKSETDSLSEATAVTEENAKTASELIEQVPEELRFQDRVDFILRQSRTEVNYWSVWRSHFYYWNHYDVIMFVLCSLFPQSNHES